MTGVEDEAGGGGGTGRGLHCFMSLCYAGSLGILIRLAQQRRLLLSQATSVAGRTSLLILLLLIYWYASLPFRGGFVDSLYNILIY